MSTNPDDPELAARLWEIEESMQQTMSARWNPHEPFLRQLMFKRLICDEALYGGQAGGGKSDTLLDGALEFVDVPGYAALLLRRTIADLTLPGALLDRAHSWLRRSPAKWSGDTRTYTFPSNATVTFGYLENEKDKFRYQSAEFQYIGFDELTQFEETQYRYLFSRLRRPRLPCIMCDDPEMQLEMKLVNNVWQWVHEYDPEHEHDAEPDAIILREYPSSRKRDLNIFQVPLKMRSGTNPGGIGAEWVKNRFIPDNFRPEDAAIAKVWSKDVMDQEEEDQEPIPIKTFFVPSRKDDNPYADVRTYRKMLSRLDRVTRKQLDEGDWSITGVGRPFFTHLALQLYKRKIPASGEIQETVNGFGESKLVFAQNDKGILDVWEPPIPGHRYVIGCDTASGRDRNRGEGKLYTDYSVAQVHDLDTHEQAARLRGRISQRHFGEYWYRLHLFYNRAYIVPAVTGGYGQAALDRALEMGLETDFVYIQRNKKKPDHPPISSDSGGKVLGFIETQANRVPLYSALDSAYVEHAVELYDAVTINEAHTFEWNKDGKPEARHGCWDDTQSAYAFVIEGIPYAPWGLWNKMNVVKVPAQIIQYGLGPGETEKQRQHRTMEARIRSSRTRRQQE